MSGFPATGAAVRLILIEIILIAAITTVNIFAAAGITKKIVRRLFFTLSRTFCPVSGRMVRLYF